MGYSPILMVKHQRSHPSTFSIMAAKIIIYTLLRTTRWLASYVRYMARLSMHPRVTYILASNQ